MEKFFQSACTASLVLLVVCLVTMTIGQLLRGTGAFSVFIDIVIVACAAKAVSGVIAKEHGEVQS
ncbi:MAG: hypothetical protein KBS42_05170 [Bacteroidales bacterium]|nr:hypothetical protein [Candidatus Colicola coprequi]